MVLSQLAITVFPSVLIVAGAGDVMTMRIPNFLPVVLSAVFFVCAFSIGFSQFDLWLHIATGLCFLSAGFALFSFGLIGGGDAKILAAAALWFGFPDVLYFLILTALAGGALAAAVGTWFMIHVEAGMRSERITKMFRTLTPSVPYGYALAVGAILAMPYCGWMVENSAK